MKKSNARWKVLEGSGHDAAAAGAPRATGLHKLPARENELVPAALHAVTETGRVVVLVRGLEREVTIGLAVSDQVLLEAVRERRRGVVAYVEGEGWVLLALLRDRIGATPMSVAQPGSQVGALAGEHVEIEGERAITLGCGESSIELRADGRIALRGRDVLVVSSGVASLQGATVKVN